MLDGPGITDRDDRNTATSPERVAPATPLSPGTGRAAIPASRIAAAEKERDEALAETAEAIEAAVTAEARLCEAEEDLDALRRRVEALEARHREETLRLSETFEAELAEVRAAAAEAIEAERAARMHAETVVAQLRAELAALTDAHATQLGRLRAEAEARLDAALADQAERVVKLERDHTATALATIRAEHQTEIAEVTGELSARLAEAEGRALAANALAAERARQIERLEVKIARPGRPPAAAAGPVGRWR